MKNIALFLILTCLWPAVVYSASVEHYLTVSIGFFDTARIHLAYNLTPDKYKFSSSVKTAGTFGKLYLFEALYISDGFFKKEQTVTRNYNYETKSNSHIYTKQLVFDENGVLDYRLSSKDGIPKRVEIRLPDTPFDANDLQTVFAMLTRQIITNKFCAMEKIVFNGKKNYKVIIKDEGKEVLNDPKISYSGNSLKCSMHIINLDKDKDNDLLWNTTANRPIFFWILEDEKTNLPFLAKIEINSTPLGKLKAYTTEVLLKD